jgi:hypothetical protein
LIDHRQLSGAIALHARFNARSEIFENRLKGLKRGVWCDPKVFTYSQPVRVPARGGTGNCNGLFG